MTGFPDPKELPNEIWPIFRDFRPEAADASNEASAVANTLEQARIADELAKLVVELCGFMPKPFVRRPRRKLTSK